MPRVEFTASIQRHVTCMPVVVQASTVRDALDVVFTTNPDARGYVLDERGSLRRHMIVFVDGEPVRDRSGLSSVEASYHG